MRFFIIFLLIFVCNASEFDDTKIQIEKIDKSIKNNIWRLKFLNYLNYEEISLNLTKLKKRLSTCTNENEKNLIDRNITNLSEQQALLKQYEKPPYLDIITEPNFKNIQSVNNPFAILFGYSSIKNLNALKGDYKEKISNLDNLIDALKKKRKLLISICKSDNCGINRLDYEIEEFINIKSLSNTLVEIYNEKIDEKIAFLKQNIYEQSKRALGIGVIIVIIILISFFSKKIAKKYVTSDNLYSINKLVNFFSYFIILVILLFSYIENMSYFITIFGFISAGVAIAMKDMLTSLLAWVIIISTGSFKVGDRIRVVTRRLVEYNGDIIDISLLKITIYEDVTYSTYKDSRCAGRIIFIPNNYIFTEMISNYTHSGMKTIWDGIDIVLTYDSNYKKAIYIIKNIVLQYSKGYTDIARKQMRRLRTNYSIKKPNVEPVIYNFFESYGITLSIWYMTSAYDTLSLRSNISAEILEALKKEPDIKIAFPARVVIQSKLSDSEMEPYHKSGNKGNIVY